MPVMFNEYKIKVLPWIVCTLFFLIYPTEAFSATSVEWKEEAVVSESMVYLADLAYIAGDDPARIAILQRLEIGEAPIPGQTRYFNRELLQNRLYAGGIDPGSEGWQLPNAITVTTQGQIVPKESILQAVENALFAKIPYPRADVNVRLRGELPDTTVSVGEVTIIPKFPNGIRYMGPTAIAVEIRVNNRVARTAFLSCNVDAVTNVYVAKKPISYHQLLTSEDVSVEKRPVGNLPLRVVKDTRLLQSFWTRRTLAAGTILTEDMLDIPPVVKRQNQVTITTQIGSVRLSTVGVALQDGRPGDVIRVQNIESKRVIMGRVIDKDVVQPLGI
jgi:flagellar basal body P-ring formation protein FlgA